MRELVPVDLSHDAGYSIIQLAVLNIPFVITLLQKWVANSMQTEYSSLLN